MTIQPLAAADLRPAIERLEYELASSRKAGTLTQERQRGIAQELRELRLAYRAAITPQTTEVTHGTP